MAPAQSLITSYAPRLRQHGNTLLQPVLQTQSVAPTSRTTKRGTTAINYADDLYDDDDFDDSDNTRRPTGLRSLRQQDLEKKDHPLSKLGQEIHRPVELQPIFRPWLLETSITKARRPVTIEGAHAQAQFPLTLIPIRIDLELPVHQQDTPYPIPPRAMESGVNLALPPFRRPELSPGYKIRDIFMWNLHEALYTPEDFAQAFVQDLDLPNASQMIFQISHQIRTQLEDYAGVALHPLFHTSSKSGASAAVKPDNNGAGQPMLTNGHSRDDTPRPSQGMLTPRPASTNPAIDTPIPSTPQIHTLSNGAAVTAVATLMPTDVVTAPTEDMEVDQFLSPDDMYRCIVKLSIYLSSRLYEDKFEWSLLHPPGAAEAFARQTCADMGLNGEWSLAITHAIYEAVLKLKKETCEGGMMIGSGLWGTGEVDNQAVRAESGAGWRYDDADFGAEWEPKLEALSKEEIEKREGDRERQLRRLRRETAKFSSTSGMAPSAREQEAQVRGSYFDTPGGGAGDETPLLGRGERSRKKRRLRSPSPTGKVGTPGEDKPTDSGWGGVGSKLEEYERMNWKCRHCQVHGSAVWAVRDGPAGPRTLCNNCGLLYERDKILPIWSKDLHAVSRQRLTGGGGR